MPRGHAKQKKANRPRHKVAGVDRHWAEMHAAEFGYGYGAYMSMCGGKKPYETHDTAEAIASRREADGGGYLRIYRCPICRKWHITHKKYTGESRI